MPSIAALRHAPWSPSKVQCALRCPYEFELKYIKRIREPQVAPDARIGKAVHTALEVALRREPMTKAIASGREQLLHEAEHQRYDEMMPAVQQFVRRIDAFRSKHKVTKEYIEHSVAINTDMEPTNFFGGDAFFRGIWDVGFVYNDDCLAVVDHKSGIRQAIDNYEEQLAGYALLATTQIPHINKVYLGVHFVAEAEIEWAKPLDAKTAAKTMGPRVFELIEKAAQTIKESTAPTPSWWCHRCGYRSVCPEMRGADPNPLAETPESR